MEVIATKDFIKEAELTKGLDITNEVNEANEALTKFKNPDEFVALLKKDHDTGFDVGVEAIFTISRYTIGIWIIHSQGAN